MTERLCSSGDGRPCKPWHKKCGRCERRVVAANRRARLASGLAVSGPQGKTTFRPAPTDPVDAIEIVEDSPPDRPRVESGTKVPALPDQSGPLRTILIVSDPHWPAVDALTESCWLQVAADLRPAEIHVLGDLGEWVCLSRHGDGHLGSWTAESSAVLAGLLRLRAASPSSALVCYQGNHDKDPGRVLPPQFAGSLDIPTALGLADLGIRWIDRKAQPHRIGKLLLSHGDSLFFGGRPPLHHARGATERDVGPGDTLVYGHTHRPQTFVRGHRDGNMTAIGLGCGRDLYAAYNDDRVTGWENGFAVAYVRASGECDAYPVRVRFGACAFGGKLYVGRRP